MLLRSTESRETLWKGSRGEKRWGGEEYGEGENEREKLIL